MERVWYTKRWSSSPRRSSSSKVFSRRQKRKQNARRASREREREREKKSPVGVRYLCSLSRESSRVALVVRHINVAHFFSNSINLRAPASLMRCAHRHAHLKEGFFSRRGGEKKEEEEEEEVHDDGMMMMMMRCAFTLCEKRRRRGVHCHRLRGGGGIIPEILSMRTTTMQ